MRCAPCDGLNLFGPYCSVFADHCFENPCMNGGQCSNLATGVVCTCPKGYWGKFCQSAYTPPSFASGIDLPPMTYAPPEAPMPTLVVAAQFGEPPLTYTWYIDGWPVRDSNSPTFTLLASDLMFAPWYTRVWAEAYDARFSYAVSQVTEINPYCFSPGVCVCRPVCQNNATCMEGNYCNCTTGYIGADCSLLSDPCLGVESPCSGHGICTGNSFDQTYTCACANGWQGDHCETDVDECLQPGVCLNGATCINAPGNYTCACVPGFRGARCEENINDCEGAFCGAGVCVDGIQNYTCVCDPHGDYYFYEGAHCEIRNHCYADGISTNPECEGHGNCSYINDEDPREILKYCVCDPHFEGSICSFDVNECATPGVCNHGTCVNTFGDFECVCDTGYTGRRCLYDVDECLLGDPCVNGDCVNTYGFYNCSCFSGYEFNGTMCVNINECLSSPCVHGTCRDTNGDFLCECDPGYGGPKLCDLDLCTITDCHVGTCRPISGGVVCDCPTCSLGGMCESGWDGCCLDPTACAPHGTCQMNATTSPYYTCLCEPGYSGSVCQVDIDECASSPCLHGGTCTDLVNGFNCTCPVGYTGATCAQDVDECLFNTTCARGTCINSVGNYTCVCPDGWTGRDCSLDIDECLLTPTPCLNGGTCDGHWVNQYTCACVQGWTGPTCAINVDECAIAPCKNGGVCEETSPTGYICGCDTPFTGTNCEVCNVPLSYYNCSGSCVNTQTSVDHCSGCGVACLPHANAASATCQSGTCVYTCDPAYVGATCSEDFPECASSPCQNGGTCKEGIGGYVCTCSNDYLGPNCEYDMRATLLASDYDVLVGESATFSLSPVPPLTGTHQLCLNNTNCRAGLVANLTQYGESTVRDCLTTAFGIRCYNLGGYGNVRAWAPLSSRVTFTQPGRQTIAMSSVFDPVYSRTRRFKLWGAGGSASYPLQGSGNVGCGGSGGYADVSIDKAHLTKLVTLLVGSGHNPISGGSRPQEALTGAIEQTAWGSTADSRGNFKGGVGGDASAVVLHADPYFEVLAVAGGGGGGGDNLLPATGGSGWQSSADATRGGNTAPMPFDGGLLFTASSPPVACASSGTVAQEMYTRVLMAYGLDFIKGSGGLVSGGGGGGAGAGAGQSSCDYGGAGGGCFSLNGEALPGPTPSQFSCGTSNIVMSTDPDFPGHLTTAFAGWASGPVAQAFYTSNGAVVASALNFPAQNCTPGLTGIRCDECACKNGGNCTAWGLWAKDRTASACVCPSRYNGSWCEIDKQSCDSAPCMNGGTCSIGVAYSCTCAPGFEGPNCEINIDDCASSPCLNGGTCFDGIESFSCICPSSNSFKLWYGDRCEIRAQSYLETNSTLVIHSISSPASAPYEDYAVTPLSPQDVMYATYFSGMRWQHVRYTMGGNGTLIPTASNALFLGNEPPMIALFNDTRLCRVSLDWAYIGPCTCQTERSPRCTRLTFDGEGTLWIKNCAETEWYYKRTAPSALNSLTTIQCNGCLEWACENGGYCTNGLNTPMNDGSAALPAFAYCTCPGGWTGAHCTDNIDECASNPCQNGGVCVDGVNSYTCTCINTGNFNMFSGSNCEVAHPYFYETTWNGAYYDWWFLRDQSVDHGAYVGRMTTESGVNYIHTFFAYEGLGILFQRAYIDANLNYQWQVNTTVTPSSVASNVGGIIVHTNRVMHLFDEQNNAVWTNCPGLEHSIPTGHCARIEMDNTGTLWMKDCPSVGSEWFWKGNDWGLRMCNKCLLSPCIGGTTCENVVDMTHRCKCSGVAGPCLNGGTCSNTAADGGYKCSCAPGFSGDRCETNINECDPNPCQNYGKCTDGINSYTCTCLTTDGFHLYSGTNCTTQHSYTLQTPLYQGSYISAGMRRQDLYPEDYIGRVVTVDGVTKIYALFAYGGQGLLRQRGHFDPTTLAYGWDDNYVIVGNPPAGTSRMELHPYGQLYLFAASMPETLYGWPCAVNFPPGCKRLFIDSNGWTYVEDCDTRLWRWSLSPTNVETCNGCSLNPCLNGGVCSNTKSDHTCSCPAGYGGTNCEIDYCASQYCPSGTYCERLTGGARCACSSSTGPCLNGGTCSTTPSGYSCSCQTGFSGTTCEIDVCSPTPCYNGGACTRTATSPYYTCTCPLVYYKSLFGGATCQTDLTNGPDMSKIWGTSQTVWFYAFESLSRMWTIADDNANVYIFDLVQGTGAQILKLPITWLNSPTRGWKVSVTDSAISSNIGAYRTWLWGSGCANLRISLQGDHNTCLYGDGGCSECLMCSIGGGTDGMQLELHSNGQLVSVLTNVGCKDGYGNPITTAPYYYTTGVGTVNCCHNYDNWGGCSLWWP